MNKERILKLFENNEDAYESDYEEAYNMSDDEGVQLAQGRYLYKASSILTYIQTYLQENIMKKYPEVSKINSEDIFQYLATKHVLNDDYSSILNQINRSVAEADYGQRSFYGNNDDFKSLRQKLNKLYNEFKSHKV